MQNKTVGATSSQLMEFSKYVINEIWGIDIFYANGFAIK
jgi:hypothetical protein